MHASESSASAAGKEPVAAGSARLLRLYLIDDHALFREGLVRLLASDPEFLLVGAASDPSAALDPVCGGGVDVVLLDYDLGTPGAAAGFVGALKDRGYTGRILLVTAGLPDREALEMIRAGVAGIFHKQHAPEELRRSIREVYEGKVLIDEHYLRQLVQVATSNPNAGVRLVAREKQILGFLLEGLANKEIAARLDISESAVKAALQTLFSKTGVRTRSQLVRVALEQFAGEI